jgi:tetratricopeptide (TPR) repeat protein
MMEENKASYQLVQFSTVIIGCGLALSSVVGWCCFGADPTVAARFGLNDPDTSSGHSPQSPYDKGLLAAAQGEWRAACRFFQQALDQRLSANGASSAEVWESRFQLAMTLKQLNAQSDAERHLIELVLNRPEFSRRPVSEQLEVISLLAEVGSTDRGMALLEDRCYHVIDALVNCEAGPRDKVIQLLRLASATEHRDNVFISQYCYSASMAILDSAPDQPDLTARVNSRYAYFLTDVQKHRPAKLCIDRALAIPTRSATDSGMAYHALGRISFFEMDYQKANRELETAMSFIAADRELTAQSFRAEVDLCLSWLVLGENEKAQKRLESIADRFLKSSLTSRGSHTARLKLFIILQLACAGKNAEAAQHLEPLVRDLLGVNIADRVPTYFDNPACVWSTLAMGFSQTNDPIATRFCLEQRVQRYASAADGELADFGIWLSRVYAETGNPRSAIDSISKAIAIFQNSAPRKIPSLLMWCGERHADIEEYDAAKRLMERATALRAETSSPEDKDKLVQWQMAEAHVRFALGEYRRAELLCRAAIDSLEISGDSRQLLVDACALLGRTLRNVAEGEQAVHYLRRAISLLDDPSFEFERARQTEFLHAEYGLTLVELGKEDSAREILTAAVKESRKLSGEFDETAAYAERSLAILDLQEGRLDEAEQRLFRSLTGFQLSASVENGFEARETLRLLGVCLLARGKTDRAIGQLNRALADTEARVGRSHPLVASCLYGLAQAAVANGHQDAAQRYVQEALSIRRQFFAETSPLVEETAALAKQIGCEITDRPPTRVKADKDAK